ncbi:hypothetical protein [Frondihabitans cladoniiphilus]|uniref:SMI1/KNR4 family protein n=1 Tax=Frondihabitans cladoniiphilus TaxID=715785 RepID=A0ABP8WD95_9MICO
MTLRDLPEIYLDNGIPAVRDWTPGLLAGLLKTYEREVSSRGFSPREYLKPGLSEDAVRFQLKRIDMEPPSELITWFGWANGSSVHFPGIWPAALDQAVDRYIQVDLETYDDPEPGLEEFDWGAGRGWLRLALDNYTKAIDCRPGHTEPVEIHQTDPSFGFDNEVYGRCRSLSTLVTWWIEGLRAGAHEWSASARAWVTADFSAIPVLQKESGLA